MSTQNLYLQVLILLYRTVRWMVGQSINIHGTSKLLSSHLFSSLLSSAHNAQRPTPNDQRLKIESRRSKPEGRNLQAEDQGEIKVTCLKSEMVKQSRAQQHRYARYGRIDGCMAMDGYIWKWREREKGGRPRSYLVLLLYTGVLEYWR